MNSVTINEVNLSQRVRAVLDRGVAGPRSEAEFDGLARAIFARQYDACAVYRTYCDRQRATPATVSHWAQIPAVPTSAFKDFPLACFPPAEAVAEFHTSGTTRAETGRHFFRTLDFYHAALADNFAAHLLPDQAPLPLFVLAPPPAAAPHSSLAHMLGRVIREFGTVDSGFYVSAPAVPGEPGAIDLPRLVRDLCAAQGDQQPVALLGTAFAVVHLLDHCAAERLRFDLPPGSRLLETGGFKGRSRTVPRAELYDLVGHHLGIPPTHRVNQYGMTELSSQFYDRSLRQGEPTDIKDLPPWTRVQVIDPHTGAPARAGDPGLIRVWDLANFDSIAVIQTEDLGRLVQDGLVVEGRAAGTTVRGCSLDAEALAARASPSPARAPS